MDFLTQPTGIPWSAVIGLVVVALLGFGIYWVYAVRDALFNPITWFGVLAVYGFCFGGVISTTLWGILQTLVYAEVLTVNPLSNMLYYALWCVVSSMAFLPSVDSDGNIEVDVVPQTFFIAYVTLFGMLLPVGRMTGRYPITGQWVGLGRSTAVSNTVTDPNGYVIGGDVAFEVWESAHSLKEENGRKVGETRIVEPAKNGASVQASLTLILKRKRAKLWLDAEDADTEVGNASRQAYLEFLANFNDTDVPAVVGKAHDWMIGRVFVTAYTTRRVREYRSGSLVRDENGMPLITTVQEGETTEEAIERFTQDYLPRVEPDMCHLGEGQPPLVLKPVAVRTTQPVDEVINRRGYDLKDVTLEGVKYSTKVQQEADSASSEFFQLDSQKRSALAQAEYRARLGLGPDATQAEQMAAALAFGQDHPDSVNVVIVPGADRISRAGAVLGSTLKKGGE